ncbi:polyketide synthase PksJ/polyketide synthase PksN [Paenibacillus sp. CF095]|uniref:non-ribosomal peptide synthetase n=1 Tax=Paenibacillus sp. CF095 TaxID=1881033 RepID=UPI00088AD633|nr:non-ribosomal peptide synthetase [Paenibacillus sp. CF095]SDD51981.1 polyketide synthase PksJ/polyketide synthase PksN [Paenibacillus sp. CF095]
MIAKELLDKYREGELSTSELRQKLQEITPQFLEKKPLSMGQKGLWMLEKVAPGMSAYNLPICFRIQKRLDVNLFRQALEYMLEQHPILKTIIEEENGKPFQIFQQSESLAFTKENISHLLHEEIIQFIRTKASEAFSLNEGPLMRVHVFERSETEHWVLINIHHIIFDGSSVAILLKSLLDAYLALVKGEPLASGSSYSHYYDFIDWEQEMLVSRRGEEHRTYWKQQLSGTLPILDLPTDLPRHSASTFKGKTHRVTIPSELKDKVKSFSKLQRIGLPAFFLAVFNMLLHQYTNQRELIVGMASLGRPEERFESLIGYFINMIPIRSRIDEMESFTKFAEQLQLTMLDGMDHSDYPFSAMVKELNLPRSISNAPVFQVGYFYQNFISSSQMKQFANYDTTLGFELMDEIHQEGEYELALEVFEHDERFQLNMKYNPDLYHDSTVKRMTEHFVRLTEEVIGTGECTLGQYPLLSADELQTILLDWNATQTIYSKDKCVHELFEEQVKKTPEATAVIYENESLTYRELDERSTKLAIYLQQQGVKPDILVGISFERSIHMIVGLLGILKSGGAYVPLDPEYPSERLSYMIEDSRISIVITQSALMNKLNELLSTEVTAIPLDTYWGTIEQTAIGQDIIRTQSGSDHLAYVMYTSGSTGKPKGVMIPHVALTNFMQSMEQKPAITPEDKLLAVTTYCFDIAGLELYLPLINGAACYICSTTKQKNVELLQREIQAVQPTIMQATPATWTALFLYGWRNEERIKILCGGEALSERLKQFFMETNSEVWNMFGPTETTIWSTLKQIKPHEPITIGKPIANTQIYILNDLMMPVPVSVPGELYIGGDGLARGYLNLPKLTAERFIDNPFQPGTKLYRTGDSARWLACGEIEYLGRIDNQVKLHGFRIELDEIESRLNQYPGIRESAIVIHNHQEHVQLRAYFVRNGQAGHRNLVLKELRSYMKKWLPAHMVPSVFTEIESIPLTPNGKVNRLELSKRNEVQPDRKTKTTMSETETEQVIVTIWKDVIGVNEINMEDGFFDVGGDSFTAVTAADRISSKLDCEIKVTDLFEYANIRELSKFILDLKREGQHHVEVKSPPEAIQTPLYSTDENRKIGNQQNDYPDYVEDSVAIIGISCQFPDANDYRQFWENLREGKESVRLLSDEKLEELNIDKKLIDNPAFVPIQLTIDGKELFDPEFFKISPKDAEMMDPQMRLLLLHSWKAVEDAGYCSNDIPNTAVYMSSSNNFYQAPDDPQQVHVIDDADTYVSWILGQAGTIPTMISYQLGLKGPSFSVHSNCSSSLAGMYSAFQSLRSGESDYALVGASTIHSSTSAGYVHMPGLNFSGDGHLKAFDATADGMIGGEGAAVIVLKSAKKAIEDGDNIYAMLRDIKLNNDGSDKVGFYAPSIKGQANVIQSTLESTKIDPETIGYIEAHGTGTKLGDPIEIAALSQIFNKYTTKRQFCGIGSVKTNIGHLDTVAGLAGCIKVALSLYHNQIPASLNFKEANREIDLRQSPFYVVDQLQSIENRPYPFRAALSSFGIGGTNAHAIFEKYTEMNSVESLAQLDNSRSYLIPLSARNDDRLRAYAHDLLRYMRSENRHQNLSNVAFTLQVGRKKMNSRVIFLVNDAHDLISKLEAFVEGKTNIDNCFEKKANQAEDSIQWFERDEDSGELIVKWIMKDKKKKLAMLWVNGLDLDWTLFYNHSPRPRRVSLPTYPFAQERYWRPGSSSEPVAAIAKETVQKLHPFVDRNTSDFMSQKYTTTLIGSEFFLVDHVIHNQKVLPGVAYIEMGRAAGELAAKRKIHKIKQIVWARPIIVEESLNMEIVLTPLDNEIEFKVCTYEEEQQVIHAQGKLEVRSNSNRDTEQNVEESNETFDIESCLARCLDRIDHTDFYGSSASADVYQYGPTFRPIKALYYNESEAISRIELPVEREEDFDAFTLHPSLLEGCLQTIVGLLQGRDTSPFMPFSIDEVEVIRPFPKECYVYATRADQDSNKTGASKFNLKLYDPQGRMVAFIRNYSIRTITATLETSSSTSDKLETLYYHNSWEKTTLEQYSGTISGPLLIFTDSEQAQDAFISDFPIILVNPGEVFKAGLNDNYVINPERQEDYHKLLVDLVKKDRLPNQIVHMWSHHSSSYELDAVMNKGIYSLFYLTKSLTEVAPHEKVKLLLVYNAQITIASALCEAISGFAKTVRLEFPKFVYKTVQLQSESVLTEHIAAVEFEAEDGDEIRYTEEGRFVKRLKEGPLEQETTDKPMPFRNNGVYLITGGMGGIGIVLAKHLASTTQARLALIGRSSLDEDKQSLLDEVESLGSEVLYIQADMSVSEEVESALAQIRSRFQALHGIIHCAGVLDDKLIVNKSYEEMKTVLAPKVNGTIWLDEASKEDSLDFFILFSSVSHLGNVGQADYAYANSFLNSFAKYRENLQIRNKRSGKTISINWPYWEERGVRNAVK